MSWYRELDALSTALRRAEIEWDAAEERDDMPAPCVRTIDRFEYATVEDPFARVSLDKPPF